MKRTHAIAFDWGGVLTIGTFDGRTTQGIAARYDRPLNDVQKVYFSLVQRLEVGEWSLERFWDTLSRSLDIEAPFPPFKELFLDGITANPAMWALLPALRNEFRLGLLSNNYPEVSAALRQDESLKIFDALVFSNEIGVKKPDPQAFAALSAALGVAPKDTVFVDDTQENLDAAEALGFHGLLFDTLEVFTERLNAWTRHAKEM